MKLYIRKVYYFATTILFSGNWSAYYILWLRVLFILAFPLDLFLSFIECLFLKAPKQESKYPMVFVLGIQRTGSTFVSQSIANALPVMPFGNYASIFRRSKYFVHRIARNWYKRTNKPVRNFYGTTTGIFSLSDVYEVYDRWFGGDHYSIPTSIDEKTIQRITSYFYYYREAYKKPILSKSNRNSMCIDILNKVFPNCIIINVTRAPEETILSTIKASYEFFGTSDYLWGLRPSDNFKEEDYENEIDLYCAQYRLLEKKFNQDINQVDQSKVIHANYHDFCADPNKFLKEIVLKISAFHPIDESEIRWADGPYKKSKRLSDESIKDKIRERYLYYKTQFS